MAGRVAHIMVWVSIQIPHQITLNSYPHLTIRKLKRKDYLYLQKYLLSQSPNHHQVDNPKSKNDETNPFRCYCMEVIQLQGIIRFFGGALMVRSDSSLLNNSGSYRRRRFR